MLSFELIAEPLAATIFALAQAMGGQVGTAVIVVSLMVRLAMMPLSLKLAQHSFRRRQAMEKIQPRLKALQKRFKKDPKALAEAAGKLFQEHDIQPLDSAGIKGALLQAPIFITLWQAVKRVSEAGGRFLWIGDLARPDGLIAILAAAITAWGASLAAVQGQEIPNFVLALPAILTLMFLWQAAAGVGLYWASSSLVGVAQGRLIRRWAERQP